MAHIILLTTLFIFLSTNFYFQTNKPCWRTTDDQAQTLSINHDEQGPEAGGDKKMVSVSHDKKIPYTVLVEGNVGAGKSTLVEILSREDPRIAGVPEPVEAWQNVSGTGINILDLMFRNGTRWSGAFQLTSHLSRLQVALDIDETRPVRIMERSIFSERFCFLENQFATGQISQVEYSLMDRWFKLNSKAFEKFVKPDIIVYLRADLPALELHIKTRGRAEEANMDFSFLEGLQRFHEDWLYFRNSSYPVPAPVLILNASLPHDEYVQEVKDFKSVIIPPHILEPLDPLEESLTIENLH